MQQAFEDGHVVDVEAGNALRFGIKQSPEPRRGDEALCRRLAESHALPAHGGGQMRQRRGGQEVEGILEHRQIAGREQGGRQPFSYQKEDLFYVQLHFPPYLPQVPHIILL